MHVLCPLEQGSPRACTRPKGSGNVWCCPQTRVGYAPRVTLQSGRVRVSIKPLPTWLEFGRLLGTLEFEVTPLGAGEACEVTCTLSHKDAAGVQARLRGLGIDGKALEVVATPPLSRSLVRAGRLQEARDRRDASPGFVHPLAHATGEGRFSLTPEAIALELGRLAQNKRVVEACAGSGGNSIGFARAGCEVTAFELDPARLSEARHNARLYGVSGKIRFELGDACALVPTRSADLLFVDPPWGGEQYDKLSTARDSFPLLDSLLTRDLSGYGEIWIKVPSSFRVDSVRGAVAQAWFGVAQGDRHRIKFVLLRLTARDLSG